MNCCTQHRSVVARMFVLRGHVGSLAARTGSERQASNLSHWDIGASEADTAAAVAVAAARSQCCSSDSLVAEPVPDATVVGTGKETEPQTAAR